MNPLPSVSGSSKPYSREKSSKRHKGRGLVRLHTRENQNFLIDEDDDYNAIKAIRLPESWKGGHHAKGLDWDFSFHDGTNNYAIRSVSATASALREESMRNRLVLQFELDDEHRVSDLQIGDEEWHELNRSDFRDFVGDLPDEVLSLSALKKLSVYNLALISLPSNITQLKNLEELALNNLEIDHIGNIPEYIGNLNNIRNLNITRLRVCDGYLYSLPSSIGNFSGLEELHMRYCPFGELSEEFGDLSALRKLILYRTSVSITSSIRRLQNLEELELILEWGEDWDRFVDHNAIEHIGHLVNLRKLWLGCENRGNNPLTFPPCMGNLHQLEWLSLDKILIPLPKLEIMRKLSNLKSFYYWCSPRDDDGEFMLDLAQACPRLGDVSHCFEVGRPKLTYALACNRFKFRTNFGCGSKEFSPLLYKMWPQILGNPTHGFREYHAYREQDPTTKPHDALYKLLLDGRESFIQALRHCDS